MIDLNNWEQVCKFARRMMAQLPAWQEREAERRRLERRLDDERRRKAQFRENHLIDWLITRTYKQVCNQEDCQLLHDIHGALIYNWDPTEQQLAAIERIYWLVYEDQWPLD